ncbi:MAG: hypothetical protein Q6367_004220 [Candidatus Freyarchaeota archaeon]
MVTICVSLDIITFNDSAGYFRITFFGYTGSPLIANGLQIPITLLPLSCIGFVSIILYLLVGLLMRGASEIG